MLAISQNIKMATVFNSLIYMEIIKNIKNIIGLIKNKWNINILTNSMQESGHRGGKPCFLQVDFIL